MVIPKYVYRHKIEQRNISFFPKICTKKEVKNKSVVFFKNFGTIRKMFLFPSFKKIKNICLWNYFDLEILIFTVYTKLL